MLAKTSFLQDTMEKIKRWANLKEKAEVKRKRE